MEPGGIDISQNFSPARNLDTFGTLVSIVVQNATVLAGIISFLLLVFGGFSIIMGAGGGDTKQIEQGQKAMTGAVVGLLIVVTSVWIVSILEKITGVQLLSLPSL